jgi:hypothetical protein
LPVCPVDVRARLEDGVGCARVCIGQCVLAEKQCVSE